MILLYKVVLMYRDGTDVQQHDQSILVVDQPKRTKMHRRLTLGGNDGAISIQDKGYSR